MVKLKNIPGLAPLYDRRAESAPVHENSNGGVIITDLGLTDKINLRTRSDNSRVREALKHVVGTDLPTEYNSFNSAGRRSIIWLGPDEWLIVGENGSSERIIAALDKPQVEHIAVVDVSDAFGMLSLEGVHARDVLAKHCAIDFHPSQFTKGRAVQSLMAHAGVVIVCAEIDRFIIIGRSSFMPYLLDLMVDASLEYGFKYKPASPQRT